MKKGDVSCSLRLVFCSVSFDRYSDRTEERANTKAIINRSIESVVPWNSNGTSKGDVIVSQRKIIVFVHVC